MRCTNYSRANRQGLYLIDIDNTLGCSEGVERFCKLAKVSEEELRQLGKEAEAIGCLANVSKKELIITPARTEMVTRNIRSGFNRIDGTILSTDEDEAKRYSIMPRWQNNSCAVDVTLFAAIMLNIGRIQIDQLTYKCQNALRVPALMVRATVRTLWGMLDQKTRNRLRNHLAEALEQMDPTKLKQGSYIDIGDILEPCFAGNPQLEFTMVKASVCGHEVPLVSEDAGMKRTCSMHIANLNNSLESKLNLIFSLKQSRGQERCDAIDCDKRPRRGWVVVDRLPPTLLVILGDTVTEARNKMFGLGKDICFDAMHTKGMMRAKYRMIGCVFRVEENHFVGRWNCEDALVEYDGMVSPSVGELDGMDWYSGMKAEDGVVAAFYSLKALPLPKIAE